MFSCTLSSVHTSSAAILSFSVSLTCKMYRYYFFLADHNPARPSSVAGFVEALTGKNGSTVGVSIKNSFDHTEHRAQVTDCFLSLLLML